MTYATIGFLQLTINQADNLLYHCELIKLSEFLLAFGQFVEVFIEKSLAEKKMLTENAIVELLSNNVTIRFFSKLGF